MNKELIGYEENYTINSNGTIYSNKVKDYLKPNPHKDIGYYCVSLWKNNKGTTYYVHRLIAHHFIPNPDNKPEVNHIDGDRNNNNVSNLEWVTSSENSQHAVDTGLRTYTNRLTKDEFLECLHSVIQGESYASLSNRVPYKVPFLSTKVRKIAKEVGLENELNASLKEQRAVRNRKVLLKINEERATTSKST